MNGLLCETQNALYLAAVIKVLWHEHWIWALKLSRALHFSWIVFFFWNKVLNTSLRHTRDPFMTNKILGKTFDVVRYSRTVHTISLNQKLAIELFVDGLIFCLCIENGRVLFLQWPILNRIHVAALHWHVFMFGCHLPN